MDELDLYNDSDLGYDTDWCTETIDSIPQNCVTTGSCAEVATTTAVSSTVSFGTTTITVDIADTEAERELGLSGTKNLANGTGLFFIFD